MTDKPFVKRWSDGRDVVVAQLTETEAKVRIGVEYHIMPIEEWRHLPLCQRGGQTCPRVLEANGALPTDGDHLGLLV
jgi:hypothetical protein